MSRCILKPKEELKDKVSELVIGFDRPLNVWFIQVFGGIDKDGDDVILIDEWAKPAEIAVKMFEYADMDNPFNKGIYLAILERECPQSKYGTDQVLDYRTTKLNNMFPLSEDDTRDLSIWITDMLVELGYVKDCTDTNDQEEFEVQDMITEAIEICGVRGGSELVAASIADNMMKMGLETYSWDLDHEVRTDLENKINQKIVQFKEERCS